VRPLAHKPFHPLNSSPSHKSLPAQVLEVFEFEFKVAAASVPNTCADRPAIGGPEPTPTELSSLFDLFQVGAAARAHDRVWPCLSGAFLLGTSVGPLWPRFPTH
jgi:hypothetical protein